MLFLLTVVLTQVHGMFLFNPEISSFIVLRHLRISTDNEQYYIGCPDDLNHITLRLLNYSNENCFNLHSTSTLCVNHNSPCKFHAEPVQLHCNHHSYSNHVDITYQCSYKYVKEIFLRQKKTKSISIVAKKQFLQRYNVILFLYMTFHLIRKKILLYF